MFYSDQLLCLKNNTGLSIVYYISTTNNAFHKIKRRKVEGVDIKEILSNLRSPSKPLALRLYSYLVKGAIRVFYLKLRYCELDMMALLYKPVRRESVERKRKPHTEPDTSAIEDVIKSYITGESNGSEEELVRRSSASTVTGSIISNVMNVGSDANGGELDNSVGCLNYDYDDNITLTSNCDVKEKRVRLDKVIELDPKKVRMIQFGRDAPLSMHFLNPIADTPLASAVKSAIAQRNAQNENVAESLYTYDGNDIDELGLGVGMENSSSVETMRYSSSVIVELASMLGDSSQTLVFNKHMEPLKRRERAMEFYSLIVEADSGNIFVEQLHPYGDIMVRSNNVQGWVPSPFVAR